MTDTECLDHVEVHNQKDIDTALGRIYFQWNLARRNGDHVVVEIFASKEVNLEVIG